MNARCDLRLESSAGRGRLAPGDAVHAAAAIGCRVVALADLGTGAGLAGATEVALATGVALLPAVALAVRHGDDAMELVAYGCDTPPIPAPEGGPARSASRREDRECGRSPHRRGEGSASGPPPATDDPPRLALADAVAAVHAAGGVAVLAGPLPDTPDRAAERLLAASNAAADGVEAWHPAHPPAVAAHARALAARLGLVATGTGDAVPAEAWRPLVARWLDGPLLLLVGGEVATGKSRVARGLAALTGATHLSSDAIREELFPLAEVGREAKYGPHASAAVFRVLALEAERLLRQGRAVVCDAVLRGRALQADLVGRARAGGARVVAVACECAEAEQRARLRSRRPGADHFSEAGEPVLDLLRAREREQPDAYAPFTRSSELASADALIVADSTPGAAPARIHGARTPLAVWFATALGAGLC